MGAAVTQPGRRRRLDDLSCVHDHDLVGDLQQQRQVVRDEQHREPELLLQLQHLPQDLLLDDHVEAGGGLVHDHDLGLDRERHRDHHALAHAAGELVRVGAKPLGLDPDHLDQLARAVQRRRP